MLVGAALSATALTQGSARAAVTPDRWAPEPSATAALAGSEIAADVAEADRSIPLDALTPERLRDRIEKLGWVFVIGKGRESQNPQSHSTTWVVAHPPGIDAVVTLYRFESQAYLEAVLPFVEGQDELQIARGERTLLYTRIRRNPERAQALLAELQQD